MPRSRRRGLVFLLLLLLPGGANAAISRRACAFLLGAAIFPRLHSSFGCWGGQRTSLCLSSDLLLLLSFFDLACRALASLVQLHGLGLSRAIRAAISSCGSAGPQPRLSTGGLGHLKHYWSTARTPRSKQNQKPQRIIEPARMKKKGGEALQNISKA